MEKILTDNILELISKLNLIELSDLILKIEKKFNLSVNNQQSEQKKNSFSIFLKEIGDKKINLIKLIKELTNLSLKESKDLIEKKDSLIKSNLNKEECDEMVKKIVSLGAKVEIK
ncbi:ribosomal protein L7/L12 [Candidatus Carsonella ruddii]|uniref:Large ribosomal subunit protein bL12 n=2 Tax=cellular organisms TaxID=131567 RepID=A0AAJ6FQS0_CARRU|nr:bL12 family ribosomal protein [Candidatus Carsonella ruddii]WGS66651.1 ribosomal protein L7/L12 [Candidatus Carsonella ruddii]WGS66847.1 ribosomal protein L7/L12 [Candidatus Carsonella ruddii]WGS67039.1 ribosomal protein L7/L12 [Candidatus Carsonella ruddii]WGS67231.1 ribosomal protein L7/L12 [Candidatus Carsonella ruddii]WMC18248.1 MAG: ribosomal protein L7/L12 [Candidatus Carsonella ruddii]